jgi:hypothetical protein
MLQIIGPAIVLALAASYGESRVEGEGVEINDVEPAASASAAPVTSASAPTRAAP